jgi:allophanate hydrolase subunit 1
MAYFNVIILRRIRYYLSWLLWICLPIWITTLAFHLDKAESFFAQVFFFIAIFLLAATILILFGTWRIRFKIRKQSDKGTVKKLVPEELASKVDSILRNAEIEVIYESLERVSPEELKGLERFADAGELRLPPQFQLLCQVPGSDKVLVYFDAPKFSPGQLIMSLQPISSKRNNAPDLQTLDKVRSILEENGAADLPDYLRKST